MLLKGLTALVTGSTSGIGLSIAEALAKQGAALVLNGICSPEEATRLQQHFATEYQAETHFSPADMSKPDQIREMIAQAEKRFGKVDIVVNNAGIQHVAKVEEFPDEKWDAILAINLSASFHIIKAVMGGMKTRNFGRIVNIASVHGLVASANKSAYVTAKHGLVGLTKAVALEAAAHNITCNAICPGWVLTPLVQKQIEERAAQNHTSIAQETEALVGEKQPNKRFAHAEEIAKMALFLCDPTFQAATGTCFTVDGGWSAW